MGAGRGGGGRARVGGKANSQRLSVVRHPLISGVPEYGWNGVGLR